MAKTLAELNALVEQKLEADTDFQSSLEGLTEEEKTTKLDERKQSELDSEISRLADEADAKKKSDEIAQNQKVRAEKAEAALKQKPKGDTGASKTPEGEEYSRLDILSLVRNNVPDEDVGEVSDYAKLKGISVAEALKTGIVQTILKTRAEERETAGATNTKKSARGTGKVNGTSLLDRARSHGELPDSDEGMRELAKARFGIK